MLFALYYVKWHYTDAVVDLIGIVRNFAWFFFEFFSVKLLIKTLFAPFQKLGENYKGGLNLGNFAETLLVNGLMRMVGFFLRSLLILLGILFSACAVIIGLFFLIAWLLAPFLVFLLVVLGIKLIAIP